MGWVFDHSASTGSTRLVLLSISNHIDSGTGEGWCYVKTICREARVSTDSYHRGVKALIELGELEREENGGGGLKTRADARPNLFRLPLFAAKRPPQDAHPDRARGPHGAEEGPPQDAHPAASAGSPPIAFTDSAIKEPSENTLSLGLDEMAPPPAAPDRFDEFWSRYPRKTGKANARKSWDKAIRKHTAETILAGLEANMRDLGSREPQYVPHAATWLNGERWNDEPPARGRSSGPSPRGGPAPVSYANTEEHGSFEVDPFAHKRTAG